METTSVTATAATTAAPTTGTRTDTPASGDAFAALLHSLTGRFQGGTPLLDANIIHQDAPPPEPKQPDSHDDAAPRKDTKQADAADKNSDGAKDAKSDKPAVADKPQTAAEPQAAADPTVAQLAALQAQLLATAPKAVTVQTVQVVQAAGGNAPTANAAQAVATGPQQTADVQTVQTNATAAAATTAQVQTQTAAPVLTKAVVQTAQTAQTAAAPVVQTATQATATLTAPEKAASKEQTAPVQADTDAKIDPNAQATVAQAKSAPQTQAARSQSEALSRLLGADNQIKVNVAVDAAKPATPSINPYNHFIGYSLGANAAASLANGQFGEAAPTNALTEATAPTSEAASTSAAPNAATAALMAAAAPATAAPGPTATTTTAASSAATSAIGEVAAPESAADADPGQAGLGEANVGTNGTSQTNATNGSAPASGAKPTVTPTQIFDQIKVQITRATKAGADHVTIQLRPEELGRVEVKLEMEQDGKVKATVIADKPETLQLMQNDARGLERALSDAGLRTDPNLLEFSLRGDSNPQLANSGGSGTGAGNGTQGAANAPTEDPTYDYSQAASARGGVDTYA